MEMVERQRGRRRGKGERGRRKRESRGGRGWRERRYKVMLATLYLLRL